MQRHLERSNLDQRQIRKCLWENSQRWEDSHPPTFRRAFPSPTSILLDRALAQQNSLVDAQISCVVPHSQRSVHVHPHGAISVDEEWLAVLCASSHQKRNDIQAWAVPLSYTLHDSITKSKKTSFDWSVANLEIYSRGRSCSCRFVGNGLCITLNSCFLC